MARDDRDVGVIILAGERPDAFCSGGAPDNLRHARYMGDDTVAERGIGRLNVLDLQILMRRIPKPIVAMVAGYAIGAVTSSDSVCDLSIAGGTPGSAKTGPKVGSFDGGYGSLILARTIGLKRAKEVWFSCRQYDAEQALDWGSSTPWCRWTTWKRESWPVLSC